MQQKKNTLLGKIKNITFYFFFIFFLFFVNCLKAENVILEGKFLDVKILDKVSSKDQILKLEIGIDKLFKNLSIKALKCSNSEFDDNPEITAYLQVTDKNDDNNNKVFVFNGWTFSSSPSINPFDHPVYDLWLIRCYN